MQGAVSEGLQYGGYEGAGAVMKTPRPIPVRAKGRELAEAVVETVGLEEVVRLAEDRRLLSDRECVILRAFVDERLFTEVVVQEGFRSDTRVAVGVARDKWDELRQKRYVVRLRGRPERCVTASLFCVQKDVETDRLIYNGVRVNEQVRKPDPVPLDKLHQVIADMVAVETSWYLAYDFRTWFVQLRLGTGVAPFFVVRRRSEFWRVCGLPMGFAWAPLVAQLVAKAVVEETIRRLAEDVRGGVLRASVYIDNILFILKGEEPQGRAHGIDEVFRTVCAEWGVELKEKAFISGKTVDWLGVVACAGRRELRFRESLVVKTRECLAAVQDSRTCLSLRSWWRVVALLVHCLWVRRDPLGHIAGALRWVSRTATRMAEGGLGWEDKVRMWEAGRRQVQRVCGWVCEPWAWVEVPKEVVVQGVSDAAGEEAHGFRGSVFRVKGKVVARRTGSVRTRIAVAEFDAAAEPLLELLRAPEVESGVIEWWCDNTVATAWISRTWALDEQRNGILMRMRELERDRRKTVRVRHVKSAENVADVLTRCQGGAGHACPERFEWEWEAACACTGICPHVREVLETRLRAMGCWERVEGQQLERAGVRVMARAEQVGDGREEGGGGQGGGDGGREERGGEDGGGQEGGRREG